MLKVEFVKRYAGFTLDIGFDAPAHGTTVLFGPSGCGKSTIAKAVAGLLRPESGRISIDGDVLFDVAQNIWVAPERRGIGFVFQESNLFPHMSVRANLCYGLRRARNRQLGITLLSVVALLGLETLLARATGDLSGGERQRVAIGRALLAQPRLLVMDEPLASLDGPRKSEILPYLGRLKAELGLPILYITHALDEVATLADQIVMLDVGKVTAAGPFGDILTRGDLPLAQRDDAAAILPVHIAAHDAGRHLTMLLSGGLQLWVPLTATPVGARLRARIPAREVILATSRPEAVSLHNIIDCTVVAITVAGTTALVELMAGGDARLLARVTPDAIDRLRVTRGSPILALVKAMSIDLLTHGSTASP